MEENLSLEIKYPRLKESNRYMEMVRGELKKQYDFSPLAFVQCFGCQQSISDGEKIQGLLANMGYGFTKDPQQADFILFNTCAVRENAEKKIFGNLGELKHNKDARPNMIIGISGCMTEQQHIADKIKKSYRHVDLVLGTNAIDTLPMLIYNKLTRNQRFIKSESCNQYNDIVEGLPVLRTGGYKASVTIMHGCDNFCSYCIVPFVRGREKSRNSEEIVAEVKQLVSEGYIDITLLGQNVNSYGKGLEEDINFSGLLHKINQIDGEFRVRFMTSHPKDCTHELIDTIAACDKIVSHLHLPVQSGSDKILKEMNRHYDVTHYKELVTYAKEKIDDLVLTSDIIVGFPTESYQDFKQTVELIEWVGYTSLFTFIYSKRSGTKAENLPEVATEKEKGVWFKELLAIQSEIGNNILKTYVGKRYRIIPDGIGKGGDGTLTARTDGNVIVEIEGDESLIGKFVEVEITEALNWAVKGKVL